MVLNPVALSAGAMLWPVLLVLPALAFVALLGLVYWWSPRPPRWAPHLAIWATLIALTIGSLSVADSGGYPTLDVEYIAIVVLLLLVLITRWTGPGGNPPAGGVGLG